MPNWVKLNVADLENIVNEYNLGKHKSHKHINYALDNTVYILWTSKGKFVMKMYHTNNINFIKHQLEINNYLEKDGVPVAEILKSKHDKYIYNYKNKNLMVQKFVNGHYLIRLNNELIKELLN